MGTVAISLKLSKPALLPPGLIPPVWQSVIPVPGGHFGEPSLQIDAQTRRSRSASRSRQPPASLGAYERILVGIHVHPNFGGGIYKKLDCVKCRCWTSSERHLM